MVDAKAMTWLADPRLCRSHGIHCTDCGTEFYVDLIGFGVGTVVRCPGCGDAQTFDADRIRKFRADWRASFEALDDQIQATPALTQAAVVPHRGRV